MRKHITISIKVTTRYFGATSFVFPPLLTTTVDDVELVVNGYKYNRRKVLFFIATSGVADILNGDPYVQRWAGDHGNLCTRHVPRPALVSRYFKDSPKVDNNNQARHHDLGLEELSGTHVCWFWLHVTLQGITATECWKSTRYHVSSINKFKNLTINDFNDVLAARLIYNNLLNGSRATARIANKRPLHVCAATDLMCNHKSVSLPRVKDKTKQVRCR